MQAGDFVCWTVFAGRDCSAAPVWARILGFVGEKHPGSIYGVVRVLAAGRGRIRVNSEFETNLKGCHYSARRGPSDAVCTVMREDEVPDEAWTQIALEQLTSEV